MTVEETRTVAWQAGARLPAVTAWVDGVEAGRLLLDVGAAHSILDPEVVRAHAVYVLSEERSDGAVEVRAHCALRFADVDVADWRPRVPASFAADDGSDPVVGIIGQDVLRRVGLILDPIVEELRVVAAEAVASEFASFAADGWRVESLPLRTAPDASGLLGLVARPVPESAEETAGREAHAPAFVRLTTGSVESRLPAEWLDTEGGSARPVTLAIGHRVLRVDAYTPSTDGEAELGLSVLGNGLTGWDGTGAVLYLAERPAIARSGR